VITLGAGSIYLGLALRDAGALMPGGPAQVINRAVRPLLSALTKATGKRAAYFGRDWVSMNGVPIAAVSMGHDSTSGRTCFEAVIGLHEAFGSNWRSFRNENARALDELAAVDPQRLAAEISVYYTNTYPAILCVPASSATTAQLPNRDGTQNANANAPRAWSAHVAEAMGYVSAVREPDGIAVGGSFMASRNAVKALNSALRTLTATAESDAAVLAATTAAIRLQVSEAIDSAFAPPTMLFGVLSLTSFRDAIEAANE
jgi:hypothetical protein